MIKTSAMFSAHTIHVLHVVLRDTLIVLVILFASLFSWFKYGVHVDKLTVGAYEIDGLYIKLDKKLTLKAQKIILPESKEKPSFDKIDKTFVQIKYILNYFDYIELDEIAFENNKLKFIYADNILYISSNSYEIAGTIEKKGNKLVADISLFYLKKEQISIVGKLKYFLNKDRLETEGSFEAYNIKGNFAAFKAYDDISFALKSDTFTDLKTLTSKLPLKDKVKSWIADKVKAKEYRVHTIVGKARIIDKKVKLDMKALRAKATLKNVKIYFQKGLAPIVSKKVNLTFKDRILYFDLEKPTYKKRDLTGSKISIHHLGKKKKVMLNLDLKVLSELDGEVQKILESYKVNIPVTFHGKAVNAAVHLKIPLSAQQNGKKKKINVLVNARLPKGLVYINKTIKIPVLGGNLHYANANLDLHNIKIEDNENSVTVNGNIKTLEKKANLQLSVGHFSLGKKKETSFLMDNKKLQLLVDYGKTTMSLPDLKVRMRKENKKFIITLADLKLIKPYVENLAIKMDGGTLDIVTSDFKNYTFHGLLKRNSCFFYEKNGICHTQVPYRGVFANGTLVFQAFDDRLFLDLSAGMIKVDHLNIDLKALIGDLNSKKTPGKKGKKLRIYGTQSQLRYEKYKLVTDRYSINISEKGDIRAIGTLGKDKVTLTKKGKIISVEALRIKDQMLHPLINFNGLHNGRYTFKSYGDPDKMIHGEIIIEGGVMRDFKAYNNTLAFINTLPALATLHNPGFSKKGFTIKKGVAKYRKIGDKIIFDTIHIEGTSANIVGQGEIDLKKNTINMSFGIQTARELGKVVGSIPLLGYIIMGEDKSMTVGLKISGSLSKPTVSTSATKELLKLPLDLLVRTLKSPAHLSNKPSIPKVKQPLPVKKKERKPFNLLSP